MKCGYFSFSTSHQFTFLEKAGVDVSADSAIGAVYQTKKMVESLRCALSFIDRSLLLNLLDCRPVMRILQWLEAFRDV